MSFESETLK